MAIDGVIEGHGESLIRRGEAIKSIANMFSRTINDSALFRSKGAVTGPGIFGNDEQGQQVANVLLSNLLQLVGNAEDFVPRVREVGETVRSSGKAVVFVNDSTGKAADDLAKNIANRSPLNAAGGGDSNVPNISGIGSNSPDDGNGDVGSGGGRGTTGRR